MGKKILVVDDEALIVDIAKELLVENKYAVITASSGKQCLEKLKTEKPDLILLDVVMPDMDGYNTLKEIRQKDESRDIPVIVLTGKEKMKDMFTMEGISDYIVKPFEDADLLAKIRKALGE